MGLREKAKKALDTESDPENQAAELDGLAAQVVPEGIAAESLQHEVDRAHAAAAAAEEEAQRAAAASREEIRKMSKQLDEVRGQLGDRDLEANDLKIELAKERATAKQRAVEVEHEAELAARQLETAKSTLRTREGEILRLERENAAVKSELNEARHSADSKDRDARGELQRLESEGASAERKLKEAAE